MFRKKSILKHQVKELIIDLCFQYFADEVANKKSSQDLLKLIALDERAFCLDEAFFYLYDIYNEITEIFEELQSDKKDIASYKKRLEDLKQILELAKKMKKTSICG